ncbi:uncharacterized protein TNCT_25511 [Trichonephila clavata]|uniref:Peptidase aspartic putative domain-containing protein n=1 Tax=Trichonephila clavata TaxID=2740835 RepID=A0A8X6GZ54_TRICU|nr:uncharacterized protein TNCT_25511 [Trichonephila clavata]
MIVRLVLLKRKKSLMAKGKCFICFQNYIRKFCNNNYQKCKICGSFSHNSLICESELREKVGFSGLDPQKGRSPSGERGDSRGEATTSLVSLSAKEINNAGGSVLLQTFSALVTAKPKGNVQLRCMLDGGANKSFILREVVELLDLKVVDKEALVIHTFGSETAEKRIYDIVEITLENVQTNKNIKIQAVVIDSVTSSRIQIPSKFIRNIALERGIELADNSTSERIHVLIGSDYISEILGERNIRISKRLIAVDSIFGYLIQGKEGEVNCKDISANHLIVENEELGFDRVRNLWSLETIGINPDDEVPLSDKETLKSFEQNTVYTNKGYETRLLWKEYSRELKRTLKEWYYRTGKHEFRPKYQHRVFSSTSRYSARTKGTKVRIVFDASSKGKGALSLNDYLKRGPNLNPDLLKIILRFRLHKVAFCADIQHAFLEIGIVEEDRQFLKFSWIKKGGPNSSPNGETFRYTRVTFGVKCSPFLLAVVIRLYMEKYVNKYKRAREMLYELYVDDLINSTSDITEDLRRWATNSSTLHEAWKRVKCLICRKFKVMRRFPDNCGDLERLLRSTADDIYGKVWSATLKTSTGIIKRPVQLLYNLEIVSNE